LRALVISDTHFGAWTGHDVLRDPDALARLSPHLDDVDEVIILGDLFDLLFACTEDAFLAAEPLLDLLREKLQGKRVVFVPGNHDHRVIVRQVEALREARLLSAQWSPEIAQDVLSQLYFRRFFAARMDGVDFDIRYPTYWVGRVLCTHGHYLDPHARKEGSPADKLLGRLIWSIALGGAPEPVQMEQYEAVITLLTEELYTLAQLPHGTAAQRNVYERAQQLSDLVHRLNAPLHMTQRLVRRIRNGRMVAEEDQPPPHTDDHYRQAKLEAGEREARTGVPGGQAASYPLARLVRPSDPREHALRAFSLVVKNLGWDREADQIVFAHTHQPLAGATVAGSHVRYWNTGSWIYEPDLASQHAYVRYLRYAWPGTAVLIDTDEPAPSLLELRRDLNPLYAAPAASSINASTRPSMS
jgi:UDP-2,3-diacylglucosamine pyrophosphatase LpxH